MAKNILMNTKLIVSLVCFIMLATSWSAILNYEQYEEENAIPELDEESLRMNTNVGTVLSFNTTWTSANSPYYLNSPVSIQQGVRLTIDPGVQIFANTTNSSIIVPR